MTDDNETERAIRSTIKQEAMRREQIGEYELREAKAKAEREEAINIATLWGSANAMGLSKSSAALKDKMERMCEAKTRSTES